MTTRQKAVIFKAIPTSFSKPMDTCKQKRNGGKEKKERKKELRRRINLTAQTVEILFGGKAARWPPFCNCLCKMQIAQWWVKTRYKHLKFTSSLSMWDCKKTITRLCNRCVVSYIPSTRAQSGFEIGPTTNKIRYIHAYKASYVAHTRHSRLQQRCIPNRHLR
jgi:hypothetical protein